MQFVRRVFTGKSRLLLLWKIWNWLPRDAVFLFRANAEIALYQQCKHDNEEVMCTWSSDVEE